MDYEEGIELADQIEREYDIDKYVKGLNEENRAWFQECVDHFIQLGLSKRHAKFAVMNGLQKFFEGKYGK